MVATEENTGFTPVLFMLWGLSRFGGVTLKFNVIGMSSDLFFKKIEIATIIPKKNENLSILTLFQAEKILLAAPRMEKYYILEKLFLPTPLESSGYRQA